MNRYCVLWLAILGLTQESLAQDSTQMISGVTVHENRVPTNFSESTRSITIISQSELLNSNASNLNDVLSYVAGIDLRQRGPNGVQADVGIRGGSFDQTLILINGMKVSDPQTGHHNMNLPINWSNVERIEVLKGPGARIYGQNAFTGAINIITKPGTEKEIFAGLMVGSHSLYEATASVQIPIKKYHQFLSFSTSGADSFTYNTDFKINNLLYQGQLDNGKNRFDVMMGFNSRKFGANGFYGSSSFRDQYEETKALFGSLRFTRHLSKNLDFRATTYVRQHKDHYVFTRSKPSDFENYHTTKIGALELNSTWKSKWGNFNAGLDARTEMINSSNLGENERKILAGFLDYKTIIKRRFIINPGFNISSIKGYKPFVYPGIDLGYIIKPGLTLYANAGASYRVPTYTDLYYVGRENIGNENLLPEQAWTQEVGVKRQGKYHQFSTALYSRNASNAIEWVRDNDSAKWQPRNFLEIKTFGVEMESKWNLSKRMPFLNNISLSYNYLNSNFNVNESLSSKYQLQYLKQQAILKVSHDLIGSITHVLAIRYIERLNLSPYTLIDSRIMMSLKRTTWYVEATNLLNLQYNEAGFTQMPGRWIRLGLRLRIQPQD